MSTRKIKDAIDLETNEAIYFKGHAKATYMSDGTLVEDAVNGKVSKVEGKQLSTEDFTTALKTKLESLESYDDSAIEFALQELRTDFDTLVSGDTATAIESFNEIIAFLDGIEDSESLDSIIASIEQQIAAKYTKPSTGIPKSDLASDVQTSLGKADTALQSYTEQYKGTVTGVKMNGTTKNPSSGVVDLGTVITAHQDISGKQDKLVSGTNIKTINGESILGSGDIVIEGGSGTSGDYLPLTGGTINGDLIIAKGDSGFGNLSVAAEIDADLFRGRWSPRGGKYELYGSSSGFEIRNISYDERAGDLIFNGDGTKFLANDGTYKTIETGGTSSGSAAYPLVEHGTSDTTFTLTPNTFHVWDEVASLDLSFGEETSGVANEFLFQFTSGATATTLTLPDDIKWANDTAPTIAENMIYQVSVLRGLASVLEFSNASSSIFPITLQEGDNGENGQSLYNYAMNIYNGTSVNISVESGDIIIDGEECTKIVLNSMDITYYSKIALLTSAHNDEGSNCYYLYDTGVLELYED